MTGGSSAGAAIVANLIVGQGIAGNTEGHQITEDIFDCWYHGPDELYGLSWQRCFDTADGEVVAEFTVDSSGDHFTEEQLETIRKIAVYTGECSEKYLNTC